MSTNNVYVIDSSSLIELNKHSSMDVFISVWKKLEELVKQKRLVAPYEVYKEIIKKDDQLSKWAQRHQKLFVKPTAKQIKIVQEILKEYPSIVDKNKTDSADPWVIALAIELSTSPQQTLGKVKRIVVSEELIRGERIRIPYICQKKNIECVNKIEMFRIEGWKF
ncbi:MAG: DUF4411 family protein [Candidatus Nanoarchaeia archaeon]|nr:DUF4411 family protein [Candidatus Nanoarchaeia archaeon]